MKNINQFQMLRNQAIDGDKDLLFSMVFQERKHSIHDNYPLNVEYHQNPYANQQINKESHP